MTTRSTATFAGLTAALFAGVSMLATTAGAASGERHAAAQEIEYGDALVCQTQQEAEQFLAHFDGDVSVALSAVNAGEQSPDECGVMTAAFVRGQALATVRSKDATFEIVQILVVGVGAPAGFKYVAPAAFVSLFKIKEYAV